MLERIKQLPGFLRGDFIVLKVDKENNKLTVDAGNKTEEDLRTAANTLFKRAYKIATPSKQA